MFAKAIPALMASLFLLGAGIMPAVADQCLSDKDSRLAVQSGQAQRLSSFLGEIRAAVPGDVVGGSLCQVGGRLVYRVHVFSGGSMVQLQVDAQTGSISR